MKVDIDWPTVIGEINTVMRLQDIADAVGYSKSQINKLRSGAIAQPMYAQGCHLLILRSTNARAIQRALRKAAQHAAR